jgi:hypothetical protein
MIDWVQFFANALWVAALALALSVLSFTRWEALARGVRLKDILAHNRWQRTLNIAGILFCAGIAAGAEVLWERLIWFFLLLLFIIQTGLLIFLSRKQPADD